MSFYTKNDSIYWKTPNKICQHTNISLSILTLLKYLHFLMFTLNMLINDITLTWMSVLLCFFGGKLALRLLSDLIISLRILRFPLSSKSFDVIKNFMQFRKLTIKSNNPLQIFSFESLSWSLDLKRPCFLIGKLQ